MLNRNVNIYKTRVDFVRPTSKLSIFDLRNMKAQNNFVRTSDNCTFFNPNSMGYYALIVLEGVGKDRPCLCFDLLIDQKLNLVYFELKL